MHIGTLFSPKKSLFRLFCSFSLYISLAVYELLKY